MAIDVETTGLHPGHDRVVEVAAVAVSRRATDEPEVLLDSLVNPGRAMAATEIHGITDEDVADAPPFGGLARDLATRLSDAILVAHNVYFDVRFLDFELGLHGLKLQVPTLCSMGLPTLAGIGPRCSLAEACRLHRIALDGAHSARSDALATARLVVLYREKLLAAGIDDFAALGALGSLRFTKTWHRRPLEAGAAEWLPPSEAVRPRPRRAPPTQPVPGLRAEDYTTALLEVLSDYVVTDAEIARLHELKSALALSREQVHAVHAGVYSWAISAVVADGWLDDDERVHLRRIRRCLQQLGWAPGD